MKMNSLALNWDISVILGKHCVGVVVVSHFKILVESFKEVILPFP